MAPDTARQKGTQKPQRTGPIQHGTQEATGYKQRKSIDHTRLKLSRGESLLDFIREAQDQGPRAKYIHALHSAENPYFSYFLWAMFVFGIIIETCMYTFSASPAGLSLGMSVQKNYFSERTWLDLETRMKQLSSLPVLVKVNDQTNGHFDKKSMTFDDTNAFWENPFFKNDRAILQPVCNPSFTLTRAIAGRSAENTNPVGKHFVDNNFNASATNGGTDYWWNMRRIDFAVGEGLVGMYDLDSTSTEFSFDSWLNYRKCVVQGAHEIPTDSSVIDALKKQGLIHADILPANMYESFDGFHDQARLGVPQTGLFIWDSNTTLDVTQDLFNSVVELGDILVCETKSPDTQFSNFLKTLGLNSGSGIACTDYTAAGTCSCKYQPHITEVVSEIDSLQKIMHVGEKQLVRTSNNAIMSMKSAWKYLLTTILPILVFIPGLYFPPAKYVNRTLMSTAIRLLAIYNIYNLQILYLNPLFAKSNGFCFKKRVHQFINKKSNKEYHFDSVDKSADAESVHVLQEIFPGFECTWAPGTMFVIWKIILNWLYLFTSFLKKHPETQRLAFNKSDYSKFRVKYPDSKRGVHPTQLFSWLMVLVIGVLLFYSQGMSLFGFQTSGIMKPSTLNNFLSFSWLKNSAVLSSVTSLLLSIDLSQASLAEASLNFGYSVTPILLLFIASYLADTNDTGSFSNRPYDIQQKHFKFILPMLVVVMPFQSMFRIFETGFLGADYIEETYGANFALIFLYMLNLPKYIVYINTLNIISNQIGDLYFFQFQVFKYGIICLTSVMILAFGIFTMNCNFSQRSSSFENYALVDKFTGVDGAMLEGYEAIGSKFKIDNDFQSLCGRGYNAHGWPWVMKNKPELSRANIKMKWYYADRFARFERMINDDDVGGTNLTKAYLGVVNALGVLDTENDRLTISQYRHFTAREIYAVDNDDGQNMTHLMNEADVWQSTYNIDTFITLCYGVLQIMANAGIGDIPPNSVYEQALAIVLFMISLFFIQTKLTFVLENAAMSIFVEKIEFLKNAGGCIFIHHTPGNEHRIDRTVSLLWRHWEIWKGINPLCSVSTDTMYLPLPIKQKMNYFVLEELLRRNKSLALSRLSQAQLKNMSEGLVYNIIHANDVVLSSLKEQNYILFLKSGCLRISNAEDELADCFNLEKNTVYFERECYLGKPVDYTIRCHSDYSEFYTISRSHLFKVINQSDNVGELMNKMKIDSATMKLLERKMRARDANSKIKHIVTKELPVQLQGEVLTKPFLAGHNTVSVNYYSDLQNYKFLTPRFMHSFESSLTLKNMPTDFLNLKYASDSCVRNNKQVMSESYGRWLSQEYIDSLSAMEFRLFKDWKTSSDEAGIYLQGPQKHYSAYLKEVREQIRIERTEILRDLREKLKIVKTGDGGKGLLIRETMFRNRLGSYDINMNRRAIKDMFGTISETLFGAGNELEEIHGIVIDQEEINERAKSTGNKRTTAANTKISSKAKNSMRQSDAKKVTKKDVNATRASDAKKVSTKEKNATRKSVKKEKEEKAAKNSDDSSSSGSSSGSSSSSSSAASSSSPAASSSDVKSSSSESSIYSEAVEIDDIDSIGSDLHDEHERFFQFTPGSIFLNNWHRFKAIHSVACFWLLSMNWSFYDDDEYRIIRDPGSGYWTNGRDTRGAYAIVKGVWDNIYYFMFLDCIIYFNVIVGMYTGTMNEHNTIIWDPVNKLKRMPMVDKIITMIGIIPWRLVAKPLTFLGNTASKRTLMVGMMKIIYLYWTSTGKLRMISYKLYGSFFTNFLNTLIQLFFFVQLAVCFAYKIDCSLTKEDKVNYYLNGICRQGSWAWTEFEEYNFHTWQRIQDLPIVRYKKSLIWIYKHFTAVGNSGIFASYASSRIMLSFVLILGVVMLSKVIAGLASLTGMTVGSGLKGDRKAHFRLVESLIDRTKNTELFDIIMQTKRQIFNAYNGYCLPGYFEVEDCLYPVDKLIVKYETFNPIICQIHLFKGLPSTIRHKLVQLEQTKQYAKGQVVIHQQEIVPCIYYIRYGCVKVSYNGEETGYLESTQSFNSLAMMSSQPSRYTFTCVTGCEIIEWSYKDIKSCMGPAWNRLFDKAFIKSCKEQLEKIVLPPRKVDMEYVERSREENALNHMREFHPEVPDKVMESDGTFNPTSANYQLWSLFNAYRIIINIILSLGVAAVYYDSGMARAFLLLLDVFAIINMWVTSKVQRKNNQTKMFTKKKMYSWLYYKSNGLAFDIICIVLPTLLDSVNPGYNYLMSYYHLTIPLAAFLRLLQLRHLGQYFVYKHETKMGVSYQMILYRIYQMLILVCFSACFGIILAKDEDAIANYYTRAEIDFCKAVYKQGAACEDIANRKVIDSSYLWGSYSYGITLPKSGEISIECRNMDMFKGPSNITVAQGSWLGQAFKYKHGLEGLNMNKGEFTSEKTDGTYKVRTGYQYDPTSQWYHVNDASYNYDPPKEYFSGVDFQNNHHIAILSLYYWSNVVTSTSASVLIPMKNTHSQLFEIFMQMLGLYYMVMICVEFKNVGEVLDRARQKASLTYHQLNVFFKNTEEVTTGSPIHKLIQRQLVLNYQTKSHHLEKQIFSGLPPATAKDLAADRYGAVLQKAYITEADPYRRMLRTRDFAVHIYKLAAVGGTQVLKTGQITNDVYFIADGSFVSEVDNSDRYHKNAPSVMHRVELPVGSFIVPDGLAEAQITAVTDGMLYVVSRDAFYTHHKTWSAAPLLPGVHLPKESPKFVNIESRKVESCKMQSHHKSIKNMQFEKCESLAFKIPPWFGLVGIIMATLNWIQGDVQLLAMVDLVVGVFLILYIVFNKTITKGFKYNTEEKLSIIACLPIPFEYRWIVRASFFYLEDHYYYARASYDLGVQLYVYRIIKYATWMISICAVFAGSIKLVVCGTGNDCEWNSILLDARDRNGFLMDHNATTDTWTYPKDLTERPDVPFYTFTNLFYAVFDSFTSTGFGNLRPRKAAVMFIFSVVCIAGRIFVAALLGLGGDVLEQELHAIHSDYLSLRNRIKHYLRKAGCNDTRVGYVCNFIDADYRKTMHFDIRDTLAGTCISPGLRRDFFFELFGETIKSNNFFSACSNNCISEICDRAASIEYYYAGNIVQEADTAFLGMIIVMKGSLVVDDTHVKVKGDTVFADIIDRQVPAHFQVKAFSECQIVRLDWQITRAILQLYKKDYKIVLNKIRSHSHSFG